MKLRSIVRALFTKLTRNAEVVLITLLRCLSTRSQDEVTWLKVGLLGPH